MGLMWVVFYYFNRIVEISISAEGNGTNAVNWGGNRHFFNCPLNCNKLPTPDQRQSSARQDKFAGLRICAHVKPIICFCRMSTKRHITHAESIHRLTEKHAQNKIESTDKALSIKGDLTSVSVTDRPTTSIECYGILNEIKFQTHTHIWLGQRTRWACARASMCAFAANIISNGSINQWQLIWFWNFNSNAEMPVTVHSTDWLWMHFLCLLYGWFNVHGVCV